MYKNFLVTHTVNGTFLSKHTPSEDMENTKRGGEGKKEIPGKRREKITIQNKGEKNDVYRSELVPSQIGTIFSSSSKCAFGNKSCICRSYYDMMISDGIIAIKHFIV